MLNGLILADKPSGWTSFDVVNYIRRIVASYEGRRPKQVKVGHCGTLDPFATGLLIILVGKEYTRRASEFSKADKTYEVTMKLGVTSSTGDPEGEMTISKKELEIERSEIESVIKSYTGEIKQVPPIYSAVKINGKRAYDLARSGHSFEIEPRIVTIHKIDLLSFNYPRINFVTDVSSGTYIRSLVSDIGDDLGIGAYTEQLRRNSINGFNVNDAVDPKSINVENIEQVIFKYN